VRRLKWPLLAALAIGALAAGAVVYAQGSAESSGTPDVEASIDEWRWAPQPDEPKKRPRAPEPAREEPVEDVEDAPPPAPIPEPPPLPDPSGDDAVTKAEVVESNGVALPPLEAPPEIRAIIEAGNTIARTPYKWGGGHGKWKDNGYDCSGSVSYALAAAGLLEGPLASGPLMGWGRPGKGKWLTIYSNPGHVFLVVAGVRFDTSAANRGKTGSRFTNEMRSTAGYTARHWPGL
jgi:cell wall-associated NlpC family hydrolase